MFNPQLTPYLTRTALAGTLLATGLTAGQAHATASFFNFADATFTLFDAPPDDAGAADPADLTLFSTSDKLGSAATSGAPLSATAFYDGGTASGVTGPFSSPVYDFTVSAFTEGSAAAAPDPADTGADASAGFEIEIVNDSFSTGYTFSGSLFFTLDAEAVADFPTVEESFSSAGILLEGLTAGDLLAGIATPTLVSVGAGFLDGSFTFDGETATVPVEFYVGAGDSEVLFFEAHADGFAESVAPVPLPAAVWLFGSALLGLVGVARHGGQRA